MEQKGENVTVMVHLTQGDTEHYSTRYTSVLANCKRPAVRYTQVEHSKGPAPELLWTLCLIWCDSVTSGNSLPARKRDCFFHLQCPPPLANHIKTPVSTATTITASTLVPNYQINIKVLLPPSGQK